MRRSLLNHCVREDAQPTCMWEGRQGQFRQNKGRGLHTEALMWRVNVGGASEADASTEGAPGGPLLGHLM